ncbi:hypothetical protein [Mycobacteroides abscessus]|uniref:hypothetical protein n=1 Tax=Mycobacteroides abscessus TaxID=36809 RepID=UPI001F18BFC1|nr:hypothetical protein [Mycobacteroides abscessus]
MATKYEQHIATFKGYVDKPGGTAWEGQTAEAGQANAADGWKVAARIQDIDTKFQTTAGMAVDHTIVPELTNCQHMIENIEAQRNKGLTLSEDLQVGYNRPPGISDELAAENAKVAEARGKELKESARKWWQAEQEVKHLAEGTVRDIENEVNGAAGTFDIGKAVKDTAPGKPDKAQDGNFYKDWYPKKTDPASVDPGTGTLADSVDRIKNPPTTPTAATAPVDPNAPQYGPFAKDAIDKTKLGGLGESLTYINRNDKPPEEHKPSAAERFKSDISEGIDRGVDKLIAPITDLRDRLGLGDKGFWEANEEAGRREWESFKHQMTTPPIVDTAEGIKHNIENPGQYVGERMVEGGALMAGGPEGMLPRAGLEGSAAHLGSMHPDLPAPGALHDTPAPTTHHIDDTTPGHHPAPGGDHTPTVGDHSAPSTGDHSWDFAVDSNGHYVPGSLPSYEQLKGLTQTDPNTAHFWSGRDAGGVGVGPDGSGIAERIAEGVGGGTLETTLVKNGVDPLPVWNRHDPVSVQFWEDASRAYAENTNGEVTAVIGSDLRPGNIWQTVEIPRLMDNPGVTKIVQIDPDTGKSTVIFSRDK